MTDVKRRVFLKNSAAVGSVAVVASTGLVAPQALLADWNKAAFTSSNIDEVYASLDLSNELEESSDIAIKAPDIAENGAIVPVSVSTGMKDVSAISILAVNNPSPLVATFELPEGTLPKVSTRIKMGKTGDIVALVKVGDKVYTAKKEVKVTIGGCGG